MAVRFADWTTNLDNFWRAPGNRTLLIRLERAIRPCKPSRSNLNDENQSCPTAKENDDMATIVPAVSGTHNTGRGDSSAALVWRTAPLL